MSLADRVKGWKLKRVSSAIVIGAYIGFQIYSQIINPDFVKKFQKQPTPVATQVTETDDTIRIGSFNIQVFGESKSQDPEMDYLTQIACEFDILAVQEIRNKNNYTQQLDSYIEKINSVCNNVYKYVVSEPLGRTSSVENYVFIFDSDIQLLSEYQFPDNNDVFEREPYSAMFNAGNFDFIIVNNHIDPDVVHEEIQYLDDVVIDVNSHYNESDIIVLGDMNADCSYLNETEWTTYMQENSFFNVIPNSANTTVSESECTYDRIFFTQATVEDYAENWGVFLFDNVYTITGIEPKEVSDHYPVWAEFYTNKDTD